MFDWFGAGQFERAFKSAVKRFNIQTAGKKSDNVFSLTNGTSTIDVEVSQLRKDFSKSKSQEMIDSFAERVSLDLELQDRLVSFTNAQAFLRLMVINEKEVTKGMICADFAGSLKKALCCTGNDRDIHMLQEGVLKKWGVPREVLFSVADRNMGRLFSEIKYNISTFGDNIRVIEFEPGKNPLAVSMMVCTDFRDFVTEKLGPRFMVAAPSRASMLAVKEVPNNILESLGEAVVRDYQWADEPLTTEIFYYTPAGVSVSGYFNPHKTGSGGKANEQDEKQK